MNFVYDTETPSLRPVPIDNSRIDLESSTSRLATMGAAISAAQIENDANFLARRRTLDTRLGRLWDAADKLGADAITEEAKARGVDEARVTAFTQKMQLRKTFPRTILSDPEMEAVVRDMVDRAAADDPGPWGSLNLNDDAIENAVNEQLRAEYDDAQAVLEMMPDGEGMTRFIGSMVGSTADVKNLPFLIAGGGSGSLARVIGREALINMTAEAVFMPAQFDMAERLGIDAPNVPLQLGAAAIFGGVFGGITEAGARGVAYWKGRNRVHPEASIHDIDAIDAVEDILTSDRRNPLEDVNLLVLNRRIDEPLPELEFRAPDGMVIGRTGDVTFPAIDRPQVDVAPALRSNAAYQAAREQNPAVFDRMESLKTKQETLRGWMDELRTGKTTDREEALQLIDERISTLEEEHRTTQGKTNKKRIREQIAEAKADRDKVLSSDAKTQTRDEAMVRRQLMDIDESLRDLAPEIGAAYRKAGVVDTPEMPARAQEPRPDFEAFVAQVVPPPKRQPVQTAPQRAAEAVTTARPEVHEVFSDPTTPEAAQLQDFAVNEMRDAVEQAGPTDMRIEMDGVTLNSDADVVKYIDELKSFADDVKVCLLGGPTE